MRQSKSIAHVRMLSLACALVAPFSMSLSWAQTPALTTLYNFTGQGGDGASPYAGVIPVNGSLYGTTAYGGTFGAGTVFQLTPPISGSAWTETVIYSFTGGSDGRYPQAGVVAAPGGVLYGATMDGGASGMGTVFQLTAPRVSGGAWSETVIHSFSGSDGANPYAAPMVAPSGVLYGTAQIGGALGYGAVYALTPPVSGGAWTETVLYSFASGTGDGAYPYASLAMDSKGNLYGTTAYGGTKAIGILFQLAPPAKSGDPWKETVLHSFTGYDGGFAYSGVVIGTNGSLYGTTPGGVGAGRSAAYEFTPPAKPGGVWKETVLQTFKASAGGGAAHTIPTFGPNGVLFGTCFNGGAGEGWGGYGVVYELTPPATGSTWTETVLYTFKGTNDGGDPEGTLVPGGNGVYYGTTLRGGTSGLGTVFAITP